MDKAKTKNFMIVILLLVNLFLLVIFILDDAERKLAAGDLEASLAEAFESWGISFLCPIEGLDEVAPGFEVSRDEELELKVAQTLLGDVKTFDQGGNIMLYESEKGEAVFRSNGEFELRLSDHEVIKIDDNHTDEAREILAELGFAPLSDQVAVNADNEGNFSVTYTCCQQEKEVFNARVTVSFAGGVLKTITGTRVLDSPSQIPDGQSMDLATALLNFLDLINTNGAVLSNITEINQGYIQTVTVSGGGILTPVLKISTDGGEFLINGLTGGLENIAG